jgi:flavin-dependent dehydrogenase
MREGISFAVRSGSAAGRLAASAARTGDADGVQGAYRRWMGTALAPEMDAGRAFLAAFARRPGLLHTVLTRTPLGWAAFRRMCLGSMSLPSLLGHDPVRAGVQALAR